MTIENQQVTPADATIVTSGLGRKGPEERDLPASLKQDMDLCLHILRDVLGEFDEKLLAVFDDNRGGATEVRRPSNLITGVRRSDDNRKSAGYSSRRNHCDVWFRAKRPGGA